MPWKDREKHNAHILKWRHDKLKENPNYFKDKYPKEKYYPARRDGWKTPKGRLATMFSRIKRLQPDTDLTKEWCKERIDKGICELTGLPFDYIKIGRTMPNCPSIDRIDSSIGYYKSNCQIILAWVNVAKSDMPQYIFIKFLKEVAKSMLKENT